MSASAAVVTVPTDLLEHALDVDQFAQATRSKPSAVLLRIRRGELSVFKIGKRYLIPRTELATYLTRAYRPAVTR